MQEHDEIAVFVIRWSSKQYIQILNRSSKKYEVIDIGSEGYGRLPSLTVMPYENYLSRIIPIGRVDASVCRELSQPVQMNVKEVESRNDKPGLEIQIASAAMISEGLSWVPFEYLDDGTMVISPPGPPPQSFMNGTTDDMGEIIAKPATSISYRDI